METLSRTIDRDAEVDQTIELRLSCPSCDGSRASYTGSLGRWAWYRCRLCGLDYRHPVHEREGA
jgi:rubredoxin